jgi:hypothetical protein
VGNDVFGRGTFGGGMYATYKAVNKILEHKDELAVALFAPGFTYQDGAEADRRLFHLNELALYKGIKTQVIPVDKWKMSKADHWKREGDWTATCAELCERSALFNFPPLEKGSVVRVEFMAEVMGTAPITESPFVPSPLLRKLYCRSWTNRVPYCSKAKPTTLATTARRANDLSNCQRQ